MLDRNSTLICDEFGCDVMYSFKFGHSLSFGHSLAPTTSEAQVGGKLGGPCAPDDYIELFPKILLQGAKLPGGEHRQAAW
jgi:hypothetical protein